MVLNQTEFDKRKEEIKEKMLNEIERQKVNFRIQKDRHEYMNMATTIVRLKTITDIMYKCGIINFGEMENINHEILKIKDEK